MSATVVTAQENPAQPPLWDRAAYAAAEAARLTDLSAPRVRRWLRGYEYRYGDEVHTQRPVIRRQGTRGTTYASFLDLVDLLFVKRFVDHGVSLQKIRKALDEATEILGETHFAQRSFFTDGENIYLEMKEEGEAILQLLSGGQWVIAPVIQELAYQIDFDSPTGLARRWFPLGVERPVVLDPSVSFGRPTVLHKGVATANVFDLYQGEGKKIRPVCSWLDLSEEEAEAAIEFERRLAA